MTDWPADSVERWPLARLVPYARNARTHSDEQVLQIAAAIREWGWTNPILADEAGGIISGHGRVMAANLLGITDVPVMVARGWSDAQKRAYVLADNQLPANAGWDEALLATEIDQLAADGFDLAKLFFDELTLASLTGDVQDEVEAQEYDTSDVQDRFWITIKGPLRDQAATLDRLKAAMGDLGLVSVEIGTTTDG